VQSLAGLAAEAAAAAAAANGGSSSGTDVAAGHGSPSAEAPAGSACAGKLKRLHVDPVPEHKLPEGSFWLTAEPLGKEFRDVEGEHVQMLSMFLLCERFYRPFVLHAY
jgi:hypothetical protein